jgi:maltose/moltooligosaccharide transporter
LATDDTKSKVFQDAGDWVGVIFGIYNLVSAIYAFFLPAIARKIGRKKTHALSLLAGAIGLISIYFVSNPNMLMLSMVGVGMAWASILAMPYALLAGSIPTKKMGVYMGIFNFFITFPQIVNGLFGGLVVKHIYGSNTIYAIVMAGVFMICGAFSVMLVKEDR